MAVRKKLARLFKCSDKIVSYALTRQRDSELCKKICYVAVKEYGGKPMRHVPECETMSNVTKDKRELMEQYFDNGNVLIADKGTGLITVTNRHGVEIYRMENASLIDLGKAQIIAENE